MNEIISALKGLASGAVEKLVPAVLILVAGMLVIRIVMTVIRIGRRRSRQASSAASMIVMPCLRRSAANSVMRIAVLANKPINMITPVCR